jgi:hypothetical protein
MYRHYCDVCEGEGSDEKGDTMRRRLPIDRQFGVSLLGRLH